MRSGVEGRGVRAPAVVCLDLLAKVVLLAFLAVVVVDPEWGHLTGKAPTARALTYPLLAFAVPLWWVVRRPGSPYPWLPDLLLTFTAFSDILGNRLNLYDRISWFDDGMHFACTAAVTASLVLLTMPRTVSSVAVLERSVALGMTAALTWELFEYFSFVTRSAELPTAYADTVSDLALGWLGAIAAWLLVHHAWRHHLPPPVTGSVGPHHELHAAVVVVPDVQHLAPETTSGQRSEEESTAAPLDDLVVGLGGPDGADPEGLGRGVLAGDA